MKKLTGVTKSGFTYSISEKNIRNYELVEALGELETNPLLLPRVMNLLLGKEQAQKLKEHLRDEDGIVDTEQITSELKNIFESQKRLKN
jgi:phage protein